MTSLRGEAGSELTHFGTCADRAELLANLEAFHIKPCPYYTARFKFNALGFCNNHFLIKAL